MAAKLTEVFRGTWDWYQIVTRQANRLKLDRSTEAQADAESIYDELLNAAGYDPEDMECGVGRVKEVGDQDTAIKPGDYVAFGGYGADVVFFRKAD